MNRLEIVTLVFIGLAASVSSTSATPLLYDWAFYVDGTTYESYWGDVMPTSGGLDSEGLGTLTWSTDIAGDHTFIAYFDHEIDEYENTYFNEYGAAVGTPETGQSWEIDEPGWGKNDPFTFGDIYWNTVDGTLYNENGVTQAFPDDVAMALGWDFMLAPGDIATISMVLGYDVPTTEFYLSHTDPETGQLGDADYSPEQTIYFSSTLDVAPVPEPGTLILLATGLAGLVGLGRKRLRG